MSEQRSRDMWAPTDVFRHKGPWQFNLASEKPVRWNEPFTPVRVTDISDEPDFKPGDRVKHSFGQEGTVVSHPYFIHDDDKCGGADWWVSVRRGGGLLAVWLCRSVTKLPRTKSTLLRVTGPEERVDSATRWFAALPGGCFTEGVHVERVEEEFTHDHD